MDGTGSRESLSNTETRPSPFSLNKSSNYSVVTLQIFLLYTAEFGRLSKKCCVPNLKAEAMD